MDRAHSWALTQGSGRGKGALGIQNPLREDLGEVAPERTGRLAIEVLVLRQHPTPLSGTIVHGWALLFLQHQLGESAQTRSPKYWQHHPANSKSRKGLLAAPGRDMT